MSQAATRKKKKKAPRQKPVNAVPLPDDLQKSADWFLGCAGEYGTALVIVFRPAGNGVVDCNVLSAQLTDETRDKMSHAALKAISGKPLFYEL